MRLTLRTLLAYIDNNLPADEAASIAQRLEESQFARDLIQRTRDVAESLRLEAPSPVKGEGFDANTVAEYLDNCLSADRVHEFERTCVESDVQLAEVACAHQILALILSVPAEVDLAQKQRMYRLPQLVASREEAEARQAAAEAAASIRGSNGAGAASKASEPEKPARPKPEIPDYLRSARPRFAQGYAVVGLGVVAIVVVVILALAGQFKPGATVARFLGIKGEEASQGVMPESPPAAIAEEASPGKSPSEETAPAKPDGDEPSSQGEPDEPAVPAEPQAGDKAPAEPAAGEPADKPIEAPGEEPPAVETGVEPAGAAPPVEPAMENPAEPQSGEEVASAAPVTAPPPATGEEAVGEPATPAAGEQTPAVEQGTPATSQERLGRLVSDKEVLLGYDAANERWERVAAHAWLTPAHPLLALPAYRPQMTLSSGQAGFTVELVGPTWGQILPPDAERTPGLSISYGQVIVRPIGDEVRLRLQLENRTGVLAFGDSESTLAVEVSPVKAVGVDPRTRQAPLAARLLSVSGEITWTEGSGEPASITPDTALTLLASAPPAPMPVSELPGWVSVGEITWLDRRAAPVLKEALDAVRPVNVVLLEMAEYRQKEVRWLAARCLAETGHFKPLLHILDETDQKTVWPEAIGQLERYMAIAPSVAESIHKALLPQYDRESADTLFRLLWGYTPEQAAGDDGNQLVDALDHPQLAVRVVAAERLRQLTDGTHFGYRPEDDASKRAPAVARWRERLESGLVAVPPAAPKK